METLTRENVKLLRADIEKAFAEIAQRHGINGIKIPATIRFSSNSFSFKSELTVKDPQTAKRELVEKVANAPDEVKAKDMLLLSSLGLPSDLIGKNIVVRHQTYMVLSYHANRPAYPFIVLSRSGKKFKMSMDMVKNSKSVNS